MAALLLALPVSGNKPISTLWTVPFETCGQAPGISRRQLTVSKAAHWRVQVVHKTALAGRHLESAYSAPRMPQPNLLEGH